MIKRVIIFLFAGLFLISSQSISKTAGNPGEGGGSGNEIGSNSNTVLSGGNLVNKLTGMPVYDVKALRMQTNSGFNLDIDFNYGANLREETTQDNRTASTGWCGAGWHMGFSYIYSADADTTTIGDDKYYYVYSNGAISEIVKTTDNKYRIKNDPFWKVEPRYSFVFEDYKLLSGWKVTKTDGTIFVFGESDTSSMSTDFGLWPKYDSTGTLIPYINSSSLLLITYIQGKRWNLKYGEDLNGKRIRFKYAQIMDTIHTPHNGNLTYVRESYVKEAVVEDNGDHFVFTTEGKSVNERTQTVSTLFQNSYETRFLRSIQYLDKNNRLIDSVKLIYSGDPGQLPHLNSGVIGFEKRFMLGIISTKSNGIINRIFEYDYGTSTVGFIKRISKPATGESVVYSYDLKTIFYTDTILDVQHQYFFPVVIKTQVYGGVKSTPAQITNYTYPNNEIDKKYIPSTGLGFWGVVKANSGTGDVVTTFNINQENHLFGVPTNIITFNSAGQALTNQVNTAYLYPFFTRKQDTTKVDTFYYAMVIKNENTVMGQTAISGYPSCALDTLNGTSTMSYSTNSDGKTLLTLSDFAYKNYSAMGLGATGTGQLAQVAGTIVCEASRFIPDCNLTIDSVDSPSVYMPVMVVSAGFTTWIPGVGTTPYYRQNKSYAWKSSTPVPFNDFPVFDKSNPTANGWVLTGSIDKYNKFGSVLQKTGPTGTSAATIYRSDYNFPIASIANARYDECAVFTGDYIESDEAGVKYFDSDNGWEISSSTLTNATTHFGEKSVAIDFSAGADKYGPSRNIRIFQGKDYIMSAWVYVESGTLTMNGDYRYLLNESVPCSASVFQKSFSVPAVTAIATGKWQKIELRILASKDLTQADYTGHNWCARVFVGAPCATGVKAYIDDIRFYPANAYVTTTYYDSNWRKPRLAVDVNDNPGQLAEFDNTGRLQKVYKIDKSQSAQLAAYKIPVLKKEYHTMGDDVRVLTPNGGETIRAGSKYTINWWPGNGIIGANGVDVSFFDGTSWTKLDTMVKGKTACTWDVPAGVKNDCKIRVLARDNAENWDISDTTFSIFTNRAPTAPALLSPANGNEIAGSVARLIWHPSSDPDGDVISYRIEVRRNLWTTVIDNYGDTSISVTLPDYGSYKWSVTANDGSVASVSSTSSFCYVPANFFVIRDISNRMIRIVEKELFKSIYTTLSSIKKINFINTYRDSTTVAGYYVFADQGYFSGDSVLSPAWDDGYYGDNFGYNVYHTRKDGSNKWLGGTWEGAGNGFTGLNGGAGCGQIHGEMRCIVLIPKISNPPAITFSYDWRCPSSGNKTYGWGEANAWTGDRDNAIMRFKWTAAQGYHTWYKAYCRDRGDSGWKTDGDWTGGTNNKVDKIWLRMYKYDPQ